MKEGTDIFLPFLQDGKEEEEKEEKIYVEKKKEERRRKGRNKKERVKKEKLQSKIGKRSKNKGRSGVVSETIASGYLNQ